MNKKFIDPADRQTEKKERTILQEQAEAVSIDAIKLEDFRAIPMEKAKITHPFDGYPMEDIQIGNSKLKKTWIVALHPTIQIQQDRSGVDVTVRQLNKDGKPIGEKITTIPTTHNRIIRDYDDGGINKDVVFDREITLGDGQVLKNVAFVPSHSVRAQLLFKWERNKGVEVDKRYVILDTKQIGNLRKLFDIINNPRLKAERDARIISGEED